MSKPKYKEEDVFFDYRFYPIEQEVSQGILEDVLDIVVMKVKVEKVVSFDKNMPSYRLRVIDVSNKSACIGTTSYYLDENELDLLPRKREDVFKYAREFEEKTYKNKLDAIEMMEKRENEFV